MGDVEPVGSVLRAEVARTFLEPTSVAIVGASTGSGTAYKAGGRAVLDHLRIYGYAGTVSVVHPSASDVDGHPTVASLRELPSAPDVVVVAVPAGRVRGVLEDCAAIGVRQVLVLTAGFGDMGPDGLALESSLLAYAAEQGINVVGPNSTGLVTVRNGLAMSMTSVLTAGDPLTPGSLAVIAQSGAIGSTVVERARDAGVGISHIVSTGNQRDMDIPDFIAYFAEVPEVDAVALYVESIRDGALFAQAVRRLHAAGKRLVAYLGGRTAAGEVAAASHTGKIIGRGAMELGLLYDLGVSVVDDPDDLWVLGAASLPPGEFPRKWGMVAYSGGMGVLATEQLAGAGVTFPPLAAETVARLSAALPTFATIPNPLDVGPNSMPNDFRGYLAAVAGDPGVEAVCVPLPMGARGWNGQSVTDILELREQTGKPFVVLWYGGTAVRPYVQQLRQAGVLVAESPSGLGRVVGAMLGPRRRFEVGPAGPAPGAAVDATASSTGGFEALATLAEAGLDVAPMLRAHDADTAAEAAAELGFPVVVKSGDSDIAHRAELGLVAVGLRSEADVRDAVDRMSSARVDSAATGSATATGSWLVQKMISGAVELVVFVRDAGALGVFGGVGAGGAAVELLRDIVQVPLPCDEAALANAVSRLRLAELLLGFRGSEPVDLPWLVRTLNRLAEVLRQEKLTEIELNPVLAGADGGWIVDALHVR